MILSREQQKSVVLSYNLSCFQVKVSQMMNCSNHALSVNVSQFIFSAKQLKVNNTVKRKKNLDLTFGDDRGKFHARVLGLTSPRGHCE